MDVAGVDALLLHLTLSEMIRLFSSDFKRNIIIHGLLLHQDIYDKDRCRIKANNKSTS